MVLPLSPFRRIAASDKPLDPDERNVKVSCGAVTQVPEAGAGGSALGPIPTTRSWLPKAPPLGISNDELSLPLLLAAAQTLTSGGPPLSKLGSGTNVRRWVVDLRGHDHDETHGDFGRRHDLE